MNQHIVQTCGETTSLKPPYHRTQVEGEKQRESERGKKWWSRTWTSNNKQSIKSVGGRVRGWEGRYWGGWGRGMMRVYLKHGDPVAVGCLGAGMNKTLMAHKTQRPLLGAQLCSVYPYWVSQSDCLYLQTQRGRERGRKNRGELKE